MTELAVRRRNRRDCLTRHEGHVIVSILSPESWHDRCTTLVVINLQMVLDLNIYEIALHASYVISQNCRVMQDHGLCNSQRSWLQFPRSVSEPKDEIKMQDDTMSGTDPE